MSDELTRERIEHYRYVMHHNLPKNWMSAAQHNDEAAEIDSLCDLAIRALSDHAEAGQPVAWVYLHKNKLSETFSHQPPDRVFNLDEYTVTPLYAHPPAPRATANVREVKLARGLLNTAPPKEKE